MLHVHLDLTVIYFICFYFIFLFFIFYILNFFCFCFCICCICGFLSIWTLRSVFTWDIYFYLLAYQECSCGGFTKSLEEIFCGTPQQSWFCFFLSTVKNLGSVCEWFIMPKLGSKAEGLINWLTPELLSDYVPLMYSFRNSRPKVLCKKGVLRNFAKFTGKQNTFDDCFCSFDQPFYY